MADKKTAEEPEKHFLTICDKDGKYVEPSLTELNKDAHGHLMGRKRREQGVMRQISQVVHHALKRI